MKPKRKSKKRFKVGDRVRFWLGKHRRSGTVIEDRGNLGVGGTQLIRVSVGELDFELSSREATH